MTCNISIIAELVTGMGKWNPTIRSTVGRIMRCGILCRCKEKCICEICRKVDWIGNHCVKKNKPLCIFLLYVEPIFKTVTDQYSFRY